MRRPSWWNTQETALLRQLRVARREAGLTQAQAAKKLKRPQSFVSKAELGERRIDPVDLKAFARVYGKPLSFFLRGSD